MRNHGASFVVELDLSLERATGDPVRVERRVLPVTPDPERRAEVFERELWRIAVEHLDYGEQHVWAALAGARVAPNGWRRTENRATPPAACNWPATRPVRPMVSFLAEAAAQSSWRESKTPSFSILERRGKKPTLGSHGAS